MYRAKNKDMSHLRLYKSIAVLAIIQGAYYVITGIWPIIHMNSFLAVTGPKIDLWLVNTVGVLVFFIGTGLLIAGLKQQLTVPLIVIAVGSALGLLLIDVIFVWRNVISPVYLLDACLELVLIICWVVYTYRTGLFTEAS